MLPRLHRQAGFTVTELLTTMAVVGISLSIAVPSFQTVVNNNRRATAVNQLSSSLHIARSEAITRNVQVTICQSADGDACDGAAWEDGWIYFTDLDQDRVLDAGEQLLGGIPARPTLDIDSDDFASFFVYRPNGRIMVNTPAENSGQLTFCDDRGAEYARVLIINTSGYPRLSKYQMGGADPVCPAA